MKETTDNPEEFREKWNEYIDQLARLEASVEIEQMSDVQEIQDELKDLVDDAATTIED